MIGVGNIKFMSNMVMGLTRNTFPKTRSAVLQAIQTAGE